MRKLNTPSYNILIPREKRIRAIQELYDALINIGGTMAQGEPPVSEEESSEDYPVYLTGNGANYHLGTVDGLALSNDMELMDAGCTIHFDAEDDFDVMLPTTYTDEDSGETYYPKYPVKVANGNTLHCEADKEYVLTIVGINGGSTGINVFSLVEIEDAETE